MPSPEACFESGGHLIAGNVIWKALRRNLVGELIHVGALAIRSIERIDCTAHGWTGPQMAVATPIWRAYDGNSLIGAEGGRPDREIQLVRRLRYGIPEPAPTRLRPMASRTIDGGSGTTAEKLGPKNPS
jgi:hypothetical protein